MNQKIRNGFTLVELLVALSILVMVAAVMITTLSGGIRAWKRIRCASEQNEKMMVAFQDLRRHLQNFRSFGPIPFKGRFDEFYFPSLVTSVTKEGAEHLEPGRVGYFFKESKGYLCRTEYPYRMANDYRYKESCSPVIEDVERVRFQYYVYKPDEKAFAWMNSWDSENPPFLVKIEMSCHDECNEKNASNSFIVFLPQAAIR